MTQHTFDKAHGLEATSDPQIIWTSLLKKTKTIKDAVHGDIELTATELEAIDTSTFQRLRGIKQLGPANLVYPSAQHSRFEHMLGTLYMAQRIVDSVNSNLELSKRIAPKDVFVIRLVALLHDLSNLPFGHTLEDEGRLFVKKQWESGLRQKLVLEPMIAKIEDSIQHKLPSGVNKSSFEAEIKDAMSRLKTILILEETGDVEGVDYAYIGDIVGNTICADLLDYLKRDMYFTGISGAYDERVLSYFTLMDVENSKGVMRRRLVIRLFKSNKEYDLRSYERRREIRHDVLSGLLDMLRLRYSLAEKVYFHHAKREASAIIIKLVAASIKAGIIDEERLLALDDRSLLTYIEGYGDTKGYDKLNDIQRSQLKLAQALVQRLRKRELYKPAYQLKIKEAKNEEKVRELIDDWEKKYEFEERLAKELGLSPADVIVYIPREEMGAKTAKTLVQLPFDDEKSVHRLEEFGQAHPPAEYRDERDVVKGELDALATRHRMLWKLSIYVHPDVGSKKTASIKKVCEEFFQSGEQYTLVDIKADTTGVTLSHDEKMAIATSAGKGHSAPPPRSEHQSTFSRVCDTMEVLLGSKK